MRRKVSQANGFGREVALAIKALRDNFEQALAAEWNVRRDAAIIRNAIHVLPNRCRQCKKPAAGTAGDICTCRTKIQLERYRSNPRDAFLGLLRQRCISIRTSSSLSTFVEQITRIGMAGDRNLAWIEDQVAELWPSVSRVSRNWITAVCSPRFGHTGQLPAWWKDHGEIPEADLDRMLSGDESEAELVKLDTEIAQYFEEARRASLGQANIQLAQHARPKSERPPVGRARQDLTAAMIARIKRDNPDWSIERICEALDAVPYPLRQIYKNFGFSKWHPIWKDRKYRNRLKRFISAIEPAAPEKRI